MSIKTFGILLGEYSLTGDENQKFKVYRTPKNRFVLVSPSGDSQTFKDSTELFEAINTLAQAAETRESDLKPKLVK